MEITNETRAQIFSQYWGQFFWNPEQKQKLHVFGITDEGLVNIVGEITLPLANVLVILKPLHAITDLDFHELGKITQESSAKMFLDELTDRSFGYEHWPSRSLMACQFLQSKGYDLPQYLLGGKTLYEAGLAIYDTTTTIVKDQIQNP